jgi:uncharacterized Zn finger protein
MLLEQDCDFFIENAIDAIRAHEGNETLIQCSNCGNHIRLPLIMSKQDRENVKVLLMAMVSYMKNDKVRKIAILNFINDLKIFQEKHSNSK